MDQNKRSPRDSKWLLPTLESEGRGKRRKRKVENADKEDTIGDTPKSLKTTKRRKNVTIRIKEKREPIVQIQKESSKNNNRLSHKIQIVTRNSKPCNKGPWPVNLKETSLEHSDKKQRRVKRSYTVRGKKTCDLNSDNGKKGRKNKKEIRKASLSMPGKYSCNFCGQYLVSEASLAEHIKWRHSGLAISNVRKINTELHGTQKGGSNLRDTIVDAEVSASGATVENCSGDNTTGSWDEAIHKDSETIASDKNKDTHETNEDNYLKTCKSNAINNADITIKNVVSSDKTNENEAKTQNTAEEITGKIIYSDEKTDDCKDTSTCNADNSKHSYHKITGSAETNNSNDRFTGGEDKTNNINVDIIATEDITEDVVKKKKSDKDEKNLSTDDKNTEKDVLSEPTDDAGSKDLYSKFIPETLCLINADDRQMTDCPFCRKSFAAEKSMKAHIELYCQETPFRCNICQKGLLCEGQKHKHMKPETFKKRKKKYYIKQAEKAKPYSCQICHQEFSFQATLENHLLVCKGEDSTDSKEREKGECEICHKLLSKTYLPFHMQGHQDKSMFVCDVCGDRFKTRPRLWTHFSTKHSGQKFQCKNCGASFSQKSGLQNHQNVMFGKCKSDKECKAGFKCLLCSKTFASFRRFTRHQSTHVVLKDGTVVVDFPCSICNKTFKRRHELTRHEMVHNNDKPHKCTECNMAFVQKCNLQTHMRVHSGEKPFTCNLCPKAFTQQTNLKAHLYQHKIGKISQKIDNISEETLKETNSAKEDEELNVSISGAMSKNSHEKPSNAEAICEEEVEYVAKSLKVETVDAVSQTVADIKQVNVEDINRPAANKSVIITVSNSTQSISAEAELELSKLMGDIFQDNQQILLITKSQESSELIQKNVEISNTGKVDHEVHNDDFIIELNAVDKRETDEVSAHVLEHDYSSEGPRVTHSAANHETMVDCDGQGNENYVVTDGTTGGVVYLPGDSEGIITVNDTISGSLVTKQTVVYIADPSVDAGNSDSVSYLPNSINFLNSEGHVVYITDGSVDIEPDSITGSCDADLSTNFDQTDSSVFVQDSGTSTPQASKVNISHPFAAVASKENIFNDNTTTASKNDPKNNSSSMESLGTDGTKNYDTVSDITGNSAGNTEVTTNMERILDKQNAVIYAADIVSSAKNASGESSKQSIVDSAQNDLNKTEEVLDYMFEVSNHNSENAKESSQIILEVLEDFYK